VDSNVSALSLDMVDQLIKMGEDAAAKAIPQIRSKLNIPD
jgi:hypothetical protein